MEKSWKDIPVMQVKISYRKMAVPLDPEVRKEYVCANEECPNFRKEIHPNPAHIIRGHNKVTKITLKDKYGEVGFYNFIGEYGFCQDCIGSVFYELMFLAEMLIGVNLIDAHNLRGLFDANQIKRLKGQVGVLEKENAKLRKDMDAATIKILELKQKRGPAKGR